MLPKHSKKNNNKSKFNPVFLGLINISLISLTSACAHIDAPLPKLSQREVSTNGASSLSGLNPVSWPEEKWWQDFSDPQLNGLIEQATQNSPSLEIANARIAQAEAMSHVVVANEGFQISANGAATFEKQSYNYLFPKDFAPQGFRDYGRATLNLSKDLDFWGRNRATIAAAISNLEALRIEGQITKLNLAYRICVEYSQLEHLYLVEDNLQTARDIKAHLRDLIKQRFDQGIEDRAALERANSSLSNAELNLHLQAEYIGVQKNRISALIGVGPDKAQEIHRPHLVYNQNLGLPANLSLNLLGRRPELVAAKYKVEASQSITEAARLAFYPNVNLSAFIGLYSLNIGKLLEADSLVGNIGPAISLPIFDSGRNNSQLRASQAYQNQSIASYNEALDNALEEVSLVGTQIKSYEPQLAQARQSYSNSQAAYDLALQRYNGGIANYIEVLSAQEAALNAKTIETDIEFKALSLRIALIKALGGGYLEQQTTK